MMLDYQRNTLIGWTEDTCKLISYNYTTSYAYAIPSICPPVGSTTQMDGPTGIGTLSDVTHIAPYFTGTSITGYLMTQNFRDGDQSCIKHISTEYPYYIQTVYGNCNEASHVDGLTVGSNRHGYVYATIVNNSIYSLRGNLTNASLSLLVQDAFSGLNRKALNRILYVKNLLTARGYVKGTDDGLRDILLISDSDGTLKYYYKGIVSVVAKYEVPGRLSMYGSTLVLDLFAPNTSLSGYMGTYRGVNASNLTLSNCSYYPYVAGNGYIRYTMFVPKGSLLQTRYAIGGYGTCISNCTSLPYNLSDLEINMWQRTPSYSEDPSASVSGSRTISTQESGSVDRTQSVSMHTPSISFDQSGSASMHTPSTSFVRSSSDTMHTPNTSFDQSDSASKSASSRISSSDSPVSKRGMVSLSGNARTESSSDTRVESLAGTARASSTHDDSVGGSSSCTHAVGDERVSVESGRYERSSTGTHVESVSRVGRGSRTFVVERSGTLQVEIVRGVEKVVVSPEISVAVGVAVVSSLGSGLGGRSSAFIAVATGRCGTLRDLEWYENPLGIRLVFIGDAVFVLSVMAFMTLVGYCYERRLPRGDVVDMMLKYKALEVGYTLLMYFVPPIFVSFVKYRREWYDVLTIFVGACFFVFSLIALEKEIRPSVAEEQVFVEGGQHGGKIVGGRVFYGITNDLVRWRDVPKMLGPLVEGYTSKVSLWADFLVLFIITCCTLADDCKTLGVITIIVNLAYSVFITWKRSLQPLANGQSNISGALGQCLGILFVLIDANDLTVLIIVFMCSVVSALFFLMPYVRFLVDKRMVKEEGSDSGSELSDLQLELLQVLSKDPVL
jgi:hypothetical protein